MDQRNDSSNNSNIQEEMKSNGNSKHIGFYIYIEFFLPFSLNFFKKNILHKAIIKTQYWVY